MGQFCLKCCVLLTFLVVVTIANQYNGNHHILMAVQLYSNKKPTVLLSSNAQRQKRNSQYEDNYRIPAPLDKEQLEALIEAVEEPPWTVLTFNEGKRHTVNFTPRLGRESGEEEAENWFRDAELSRELMTQRSPPFAPRLGRRTHSFYFDSRLGKRNEQQKML